jgi:hypothetical protein
MVSKVPLFRGETEGFGVVAFFIEIILSTISSIFHAICCFSGVSRSGIELTNQLFGQQE